MRDNRGRHKIVFLHQQDDSQRATSRHDVQRVLKKLRKIVKCRTKEVAD